MDGSRPPARAGAQKLHDGHAAMPGRNNQVWRVAADRSAAIACEAAKSGPEPPRPEMSPTIVAELFDFKWKAKCLRQCEDLVIVARAGPDQRPDR